eukprot:4311376-Pyramimonas_sp.AAC.1
MTAHALAAPFGEQSLPIVLGTDMHAYLGRKLPGNMLDRSNINIVYIMECARAQYRANRAVLTNKNRSVKLRLRLVDSAVSPTPAHGPA